MLVGLTGGIASGKSSVSTFLRQEGAFIIDADQICHELILKGNSAYPDVVDYFGETILDSFGEIDRKSLGKLVFNDPKQCETLNQILHPLVFESLDLEQARINSTEKHPVIVFDAPLLIEVGAHQKMDWVLLVYVDQATQIERLIKRDGLSEREAKLRIAAQMPIDDKIPFASELIDNKKPRHKIKKEVRSIYQRLKKRA